MQAIVEEHFPIIQCRGADSPVVASAEEASQPAGVRLITEGGTEQKVFMLLSGQCNVTIDGQLIATLGAGDMFGELPLLTKAPHIASVTSASKIIYYSIPHKIVSRELSRTKHSDPAGFEIKAKEILSSCSRRFGMGEGSLQYGFTSLVADGVDVAALRIDKLEKDVRRTPWHGIAGTYVLVSTFVAAAMLPFSPKEVPDWWLLGFVVASVWVAVSGNMPGRRFAFKGLGTQANFDNGITCQLLYSYLIVRFTWDNMSISVPDSINIPGLHLLDVLLTAAAAVSLFRWQAVLDADLRILVVNILQLLTPVWWILFLLKPAWLAVTLGDNDCYNLALAFVLQAGGNAGTYFSATLDVRGIISREQDILLNIFFGFVIPVWPAIVAGVSGWPVFFNLITLCNWSEYPLLSL